MYPLHPPTVHIPIGLLIGNALLTLLYLRSGQRDVEVSAYHCLRLGWLMLLPTLLAGIVEAARYLTGPAQQPGALAWINAHALSGAGLCVVYWQAWQLRRRNPALLDSPQQRRGYLAWLAAGVGLLVLSGWLGGHMVYELGIGVRR